MSFQMQVYHYREPFPETFPCQPATIPIPVSDASATPISSEIAAYTFRSFILFTI